MKWTSRPLAEVADLCLGKMLDDRKNKGEPLPYLANINVRWGEFDLDNLREMRFEHDEMDRYGLKYGDIVMCEGGEPGRCAIWKEAVPGMMFQKAIHRIRPHDCLEYRFLYYTLLHKGRTGRLAPLFTGATIKHLPREKLAKVEVAAPRLEVQERIADILSAYDDLIENNRRRIALLEDAARQLYREWFVRLRFPGHEHVRVTNGVPEGWESKSLGELVEVKKGRNITKETVAEGTVPVVAGGREPAYFHSAANAKGPVVTISASGANAGFVSIYLQDVWASDCSYISAEWTPNVYFFYCLLKYRQQELFACQKGAAQPHVYPKDLQRLGATNPPTRLLQYFAEAVDAPFALMANLIVQNRQLRAARDLLLPRLMGGEITV